MMTMLMRLAGVVALVGLAACGSDDDPSPAGTGVSAGSGDVRQQAAAFAREDIPCTADADCCVVFDGCRAEGYVVGAADKDKVRALLTSASSDMCVNCIPPMIQVACGPNGTCVGQKIECTGSTFLQEGYADHCGKLSLPADCAVKPQSVPWSPGLEVQTILGCGE